VMASVSLPAHGYVAFFVDLIYKAPGGGSCTKSTRMYVADSVKVLK